MRIAHLTDLHYCRKHKAEALASLDSFIDVCIREQPDVIVSTGDLFDAGIQSSERDGLPELLDRMRTLLNIAPIYAVSGTPTHDLPGAYAPLQMLDAVFSFHLMKAGEHRFDSDILIIGVPEPSKAWFLAGNSGVGKDEAREKIESGMRELLLGCGAVRRKHPDTPCVFLYHGSVRGATMCNGQTVPTGEITIGRDDLALVGADYYALGNIHLAQQIDGLPAYYGGSAYPCNWGEMDQKRWNLVRIDENGADIASVDYPHPPRRKLYVYAVGEVTEMTCAGEQVWVVCRDMSADDVAEVRSIVEQYAEPGSRVTVENTPIETVRATEIRESRSLSHKLSVWSDASDRKLPEEVYACAEVLEEEAADSGTVRQAHRWRVNRLCLRGATGTWRNTGLDEVDIDLDRYDRGLIGLVGANGSGKSTIIENLHPYPQMLTRGGKLQDHFRLRDSYRDLYLTDETTGDSYRVLMLIDGQNKSGSVEYWMYRNGEPIANGRKADYEEITTELFGPLALYLRSAFVAQKSTKANPDLSDATQGEKKTLFRTLAGLDYLQTYTLDARERAKAAEEQVRIYDAKLDGTEELEREKHAARDEIERINDEISDVDARSIKALRTVESYRAEVADLEPLIEEARDYAHKLETVTEQLESLQAERGEQQKQIAYYRNVMEGADDAADDAREYEDLRQKLESAQEAYTQAREARNQAFALYHDQAESYRRARSPADESVAAADRVVTKLQDQKDTALDRIDDLQDRMAKTVQCPECGHEFALDEAELERKLEDLQQAVLDIDVELNEAREELSKRTLKRDELGDPPKSPEIPEPSDKRVQELKAEIAFIDIDTARATIEQAKEAKLRIESAEQRDRELAERAAKLIPRKAALEGSVTAGQEYIARHNKLTQELEYYREMYQQHELRLAKLRARESSIGDTIETIQKKLSDLADVAKLRKKWRWTAQSWRALEQACGPDGIQALELDALAPSIMEVCNRLLSASYGTRFSVEVRTERIAGTGAKTKQVEDFEIIVHDAERETEQALDTLSGGESVWIKKALYDAFGIIRAQNTGLQFQTVVLDEADGALDPDAREAYFRMIEAAHAESGRAHTIVITHSLEAQDMIGQRIDMAELQETADTAIPA